MFLDPVQSYDNVYWAFKEIDENAHTTVIRFYEEQKEHIMKLDFDEEMDEEQDEDEENENEKENERRVTSK